MIQTGDDMTIDRTVHLAAGVLVLVSLVLARGHSPHWLWLTAFVGANLLQSGLTDWCLLSRLLQRLGMSDGKACGLAARF
jgi:hypothetical protein